MKKIVIWTSIVYSVLLIISIIFLFNNFTDSPNTNYIYRLASLILFSYFLSLPLVYATSKEVKNNIVVTLLFVLYLILEGLFLYFSFFLCGDRSFLFNSQIRKDHFTSAQHYTQYYWIYLIIVGTVFPIALGVKRACEVNDVWFWLLIALIPPAVAIVIIVVCVILALLFMGVIAGAVGGAAHAAGSSSNMRGNNDAFVDSQGNPCKPGDSFYDATGTLRRSDESFIDADGIEREPGDTFKDWAK